MAKFDPKMVLPTVPPMTYEEAQQAYFSHVENVAVPYLIARMIKFGEMFPSNSFKENTEYVLAAGLGRFAGAFRDHAEKHPEIADYARSGSEALCVWLDLDDDDDDDGNDDEPVVADIIAAGDGSK